LDRLVLFHRVGQKVGTVATLLFPNSLMLIGIMSLEPVCRAIYKTRYDDTSSIFILDELNFLDFIDSDTAFSRQLFIAAGTVVKANRKFASVHF
jgi:hypothetical protein